MMKIISPFGTTEHDTSDVLTAKQEHKTKFGLDGINSKDGEIQTEAEFNEQRDAEREALQDATKAAPDVQPPIMPDKPTVETQASEKPAVAHIPPASPPSTTTAAEASKASHTTKAKPQARKTTPHRGKKH